MPKTDVQLLKPSRRGFLFMSAGIVAATSLMKISTAAQAFKAIEVFPDDFGPMAMTIAGKDYVYDDGLQRWVLAPAGTPNWREFLTEESRASLVESMRETIGAYVEYRERTPEQIAWDDERKKRLQAEITKRLS